MVASCVSFLSLTALLSSHHDHFFPLSFHFSSSTVRLESALMSGRGFGVFAGQYVARLSSGATVMLLLQLLLHINPFYALPHHWSTGPLYLNRAMSMPITTFTKVKSSHANNDCSSFTACRRPIYHGLFYTSSSLYQFWLANPLRDHCSRQWPR